MDIWDHKLYRLDLAKGPGSLKVIDTEVSLGWVPNRSHGKKKEIIADGGKPTWTFSVTANIAKTSNQLIVAAKYGFARLDQTTGTLSYIHDTHELWGKDEGKAER